MYTCGYRSFLFLLSDMEYSFHSVPNFDIFVVIYISLAGFEPETTGSWLVYDYLTDVITSGCRTPAMSPVDTSVALKASIVRLSSLLLSLLFNAINLKLKQQLLWFYFAFITGNDWGVNS